MDTLDAMRRERKILTLTADEHSAFEARFWPAVDKSGPTQPHMATPCWIWTRCKKDWGYGVIKLLGDQLGAHRASYILLRGDIPEGLILRHECDVPSCCNPDHLLPGTHADNARDRDTRGRCAVGERHGSRTKPDRVPRGERNGATTKPWTRPRGDSNGSRLHPESRPRGEGQWQAKLTDALVVHIRREKADGKSNADIARAIGVSNGIVRNVVIGKTWRHVA